MTANLLLLLSQPPLLKDHKHTHRQTNCTHTHTHTDKQYTHTLTHRQNVGQIFMYQTRKSYIAQWSAVWQIG